MMRFGKLMFTIATAGALALGCSGSSGSPSGTTGGATGGATGGGQGTGQAGAASLDDMPGARLFSRRCASCHRGGERKGPEIGPGYNSRAWIGAFLKNPSGDKFYGPTRIDEMKPVEETGAELDELIEFVYSQTGAADVDAELAAKGKERFDNGSCSDCHSDDGTTEGEVGPNLGGRGTVDMLAAFIANPADGRWFGDKNEMPKFGKKLDDDERRHIAEYLVALRDAQ